MKVWNSPPPTYSFLGQGSTRRMAKGREWGISAPKKNIAFYSFLRGKNRQCDSDLSSSLPTYYSLILSSITIVATPLLNVYYTTNREHPQFGIMSPLGDIKSPVGDNLPNWGFLTQLRVREKYTTPNWIINRQLGI